MRTDAIRPTVILIALALLGLAPRPCLAGTATGSGLTAAAEAFIHTLAQGQFDKAEADFTVQMRRAAPEDKLRRMWHSLLRHGGAFQKTGSTRTVRKGGYTTVIVRTEFKERPIGLAVSFDSTGHIAGLHLVPPPAAGR